MLISFVVRNWRYFKSVDPGNDVTQFSCYLDTKIDKEKYPNQCINSRGIDLLRYTALYGKNEHLRRDFTDAMTEYIYRTRFGGVMQNNYPILSDGNRATFDAEFTNSCGIFSYGFDLDSHKNVIGEWLCELAADEPEETIFSRDVPNNEYVSNFVYDENRKDFESLKTYNLTIFDRLRWHMEYPKGDQLFTLPYVPYNTGFYIKNFDLKDLNDFLSDMGIGIQVHRSDPRNDKIVPQTGPINGAVRLMNDDTGGYMVLMRPSNPDADPVYKLDHMVGEDEYNDIWRIIMVYLSIKYSPDVTLYLPEFCTHINARIADNVMKWIIANATGEFQMVMLNCPASFMDMIRPDGVWFLNLTGNTDDRRAELVSLAQYTETDNKASNNYLIGRYL